MTRAYTCTTWHSLHALELTHVTSYWVREEKKEDDPADHVPPLRHFEISLKDLHSDAGSSEPGALCIRACPKRRVAAKAEAMKSGWAAGQSVPVVKRGGKYILIDANHRYHALWMLISQEYRPEVFNEDMKIPCVELKAAPTELVIQYANWLNTTQMNASSAHQIDKLRFCNAITKTYGHNLSASAIQAKLVQDKVGEGMTLGSTFTKGSFQTLKKQLAVLKAIGEAGLLEAERLNDLSDPHLLHSYYKQLISDCDVDTSEELEALCPGNAFEEANQSQVECFLPDTGAFTSQGWGQLAMLQKRCLSQVLLPLTPIDIALSMPKACT